MTLGSSRRAAAAIVGAAALSCVVACAAAQRVSPASARTETSAQRFTLRVAPFPAFDSAGARYDVPFLGGLDHPRPQLVDIDGDGDLDLFAQEYTGRMMFFENTGTRTAPRFVWRTDRYQDLDVGEWSRFVDVDGDGDLDLFAESPFSYLRVFRNTGSARDARFVLAVDTLRDAADTAIFSDRQNIPQIVDIDCDGKLDLLLGRATGMVTRYEATQSTVPAGMGAVSRDATPDARAAREAQPARASRSSDALPPFAFVTDSFQHIRIIGQTFGSAHGANTMVVSDIDQDGDPDLLWGDFFEPGLLWLVNTGSCAAPVIGRDTVVFPANQPLRTSGYNAPAVADLDGDGDLDVLVGALGGAFAPDRTSRGNLYYLEQTGRMAFAVRTTTFLSSIDVGSESSPALVDLDGDGDLDLVIGNKIEPTNPGTAAMFVYENRGTARAPEYHAAARLPGVSGEFHYVPAFADLDGDGDPDLVAGSWRDAVQYYRNEGTRTQPRFVLADSALLRLTRGSYATPALGDLTGDGLLDAIVGESSGTLNYYRNDGTRTAPHFALVSDSLDGIRVGRRSAPALVDLDGDGLLDLVVGTEAGPPLVYRNVGTRQEPRFESDSALTRSLPWIPPLSAPTFGDVNGDGTTDMMSGTASGGVVYLEGRRP
ncbi:MAG TPA: FG-GAP-like repeat-containing protein [Gemmatimonadaceae bacterium]|nr:FG-GAP-like repeat-containing protein [Gemmatimonadaceae bacterium]